MRDDYREEANRIMNKAMGQANLQTNMKLWREKASNKMTILSTQPSAINSDNDDAIVNDDD